MLAATPTACPSLYLIQTHPTGTAQPALRRVLATLPPELLPPRAQPQPSNAPTAVPQSNIPLTLSSIVPSTYPNASNLLLFLMPPFSPLNAFSPPTTALKLPTSRPRSPKPTKAPPPTSPPPFFHPGICLWLVKVGIRLPGCTLAPSEHPLAQPQQAAGPPPPATLPLTNHWPTARRMCQALSGHGSARQSATSPTSPQARLPLHLWLSQQALPLHPTCSTHQLAN